MAQVVPVDEQSFETAARFRLEQAGAESNVAIGLAQLGHRPAWVSRLGADALGARIQSALERWGVDVSLVQRDDERVTGMFLKEVRGETRRVVYYRRGSAASAMDRSDVARALEREPDILHVSGITAALSASCADALEHALDAAGPTVSFDVNFRSALWPAREAAPRLLALAGRSGIVFVGLDEARELWGTDTADDVRRLLPGVTRLVVKDGARDATLFSPWSTSRVAALPAPDVVDAVGAGDAFAAGFLAGVLEGMPGDHGLRLGHVMARAVLDSRSDHGAAPDDARAIVANESMWS